MIRLIKDNNEAVYRDEVRNLLTWWDNNLLLKTKELINFRRKGTPKAPVYINNAPVEIGCSFTFLGIRIADSLTWSYMLPM